MLFTRSTCNLQVKLIQNKALKKLLKYSITEFTVNPAKGQTLEQYVPNAKHAEMKYIKNRHSK